MLHFFPEFRKGNVRSTYSAKKASNKPKAILLRNIQNTPKALENPLKPSLPNTLNILRMIIVSDSLHLCINSYIHYGELN